MLWSSYAAALESLPPTTMQMLIEDLHLQGNTGVLVPAQQFIAAVEYCHQHCVAHRDLKLDNTLLDDANPPTIKLCDFGFAKTWTDDANMYTHIG